MARKRRLDGAEFKRQMDRYDDLRRQARADFEVWAERRLGGATPRARIAWLLRDFLPADLASATAREWGEWRTLLEVFSSKQAAMWGLPQRKAETRVVTRDDKKAVRELGELDRYLLETGLQDAITIKSEPWITDEERQEIRECQTRMKAFLEGLAAGRSPSEKLGDVGLFARIGPERFGDSTGPHRLVQVFTGSLLARVLLSALAQLTEVGARRLRRCPLREPNAPTDCGRLFLAAKRQRYCSTQHTARATYLDWRERGSPRHTPVVRGTKPRPAADEPQGGTRAKK